MPDNGLAAAEEIYRNRDRRAQELHEQGKKVIGYLCCQVPLEMLTALDIVPYRITGNVHEPITEAGAHMETIVCPFVRSAFDMALKGSLAFCDGLVIPHTCDSVCRTYEIWKYTLKLPFSHLLNVPHSVDPSSMDFFVSVLETFKKALEDFTGKPLTENMLAEAISLHNSHRALVRELYELRKENPPLITGGEVTKVLVAAMSIPVNEGNELLRGVIAEAKSRPDAPPKKPVRVLIYGAQVDDSAFVDLVEKSGANVVMDDLCIGSKFYWTNVSTNGDPIRSLAERYLEKVKCSRTYEPRTGTFDDYLEQRFGHIADFAREFGVDAVILYVFRCCDPLAFDVPDLRQFLQSRGLPVLHIEDDYAMSSVGRLQTRVQAFLETLN